MTALARLAEREGMYTDFQLSSNNMTPLGTTAFTTTRRRRPLGGNTNTAHDPAGRPERPRQRRGARQAELPDARHLHAQDPEGDRRRECGDEVEGRQGGGAARGT